VTVYLVGAGPGDPGLLTRRGALLLSSADVVIYDRLVHPSIVALARHSAQLIDVGKQPGAANGHERQEQINQLLVEHGRQADTVVRLKGGDPFLFGRGGEELEVLTRAGIPCEVVPGVTSAFGVPASAGIPVTHRGLSSSVTVVTGRVGDTAGPAGVDWDALAKVDGTLVILMGMSARAAIAGALQRAGKPPDTPVAVIEKGTTPAQRTIRTTLGGLADVSLGSPAVIVIGGVASLGKDYDVTLAPLSGRSIVETRSSPRAEALTEALQAAGARVLSLPLTGQVGPADGGLALRDAVGRVGEYDWVIFTSSNAVDTMMGEVRDARALGPVKVAAVGPASAGALRRRGVEPDLVPSKHLAQGLVEAFPERGDAVNGRVLFPCGDLAPSTIPEGLGHKGWDVTRVEAYRTVNVTQSDAALLAEVTQADAVTFSAPSAVRAFLALRTPDGAPVPVPPLVVCIGPTTAESARAAGLSGVVEASGATTPGILHTVVDQLAGGWGDGS
jgi:uroporphyrinogen III methyltransferase/synthase